MHVYAFYDCLSQTIWNVSVLSSKMFCLTYHPRLSLVQLLSHGAHRWYSWSTSFTCNILAVLSWFRLLPSNLWSSSQLTCKVAISCAIAGRWGSKARRSSPFWTRSLYFISHLLASLSKTCHKQTKIVIKLTKEHWK